MVTLLQKIIITLSLITLVSGEPFPCNDHTKLGDNGLTCACQDGSFYNANEGTCQGVCEFFGDSVCNFYFTNTICLQDPLNVTGYECQCAPGYEKDMVSGICFDTDECTTTLSCPEYDNEICYNLEGGDVCDCKPNYYRNQEHACQEINLCSMPVTLTSCEQICTFEGNNSFTCSCNNGFVVDHHNDSACSVDVGHLYMDCMCPYTEFTECTQSANHTEYCYAIPGYRIGSDNITIEDVNECTNGSYQCPLASVCVNDFGSYHCECLPGYYQVDEDYVLSGCLPVTCDEGLVLYDGKCIDPCEVVTCPSMSVCFANEYNVPLCGCQVECQNNGLHNSSTYSIYFLSIFLPYEDPTVFEHSQKKYLLTKSMEFIFGKGNAEVVEGSILDGHPGLGITLEIGVSMPLEDVSRIKDAILEHCWELQLVNSQPQCVLPGGLILNRYSIDVEETHRCDEDPTLCEDISNSICVEPDLSSGRYWCACLEGFEHVGEFYCEDINECMTGEVHCEEGMVCVNGFGNYSCEIDSSGLSTAEYIVDEANKQVEMENSRIDELNKNLDDQEQTTKTVGGSIGAVLGAIFIILVIAIVYISRRSKKVTSSPEKRSKTEHSDSPSPETSKPTDETSDAPPEPTDTSPKLSEPSSGPSDSSSEPSDITVHFSVPSNELTRPSSEHAELSPQLSESSSKPSEPSPKPSEPSLGLSEPSPKRSEPSPEHSKHPLELSEPSLQLSEASPQPTEPLSEPSDISSEPSEPSLQLSEPSPVTSEPFQLPQPSSEPTDHSPEPTDLSQT